jgi:hypothetical protein
VKLGLCSVRELGAQLEVPAETKPADDADSGVVLEEEEPVSPPRSRPRVRVRVRMRETKSAPVVRKVKEAG